MNVQCPSCATIYRVDPVKVPADGVRARCTVCATMIPVRSAADGDAAPAVAMPRPVAPPPRREPTPPAGATPPRPSGGGRRVAPPRPAAPPRRVTQPFFQQRLGSGHHTAAPAEPAVVEEPPAQTRPSAPVFRPTPGQPVTPAPGAASPSTAPREPRRTPPRPPRTETPAPAPAPSGAPGAATASSAPQTPATPVVPEKKHVNPFLARDPRQKARRLARALVSDMIVYQPEKRQHALAQGNLKEAFEDEILKSWQEYVEQVGEELASSTSYWKEALNEILAAGREVF